MPTPGNSGVRIITITPLHIKAAPVKFSSIITQYTDTWTPQWRQEFVYGRMDPISFYGGTDRKLTLGFRVISENQGEATTNMQAIQRLLQLQYPTFDTQFGQSPQQAIATVKAPPYFKVKLFNVTNVGSEHVQGYFNGPITINPGFQDKTKNQYYTDGNTKLLFSDVEITLQMVVLHQKKVGFYGDKFGGEGSPYPYNIGGGGVGATGGGTEDDDLKQTTDPLDIGVTPLARGEDVHHDVGVPRPVDRAPTTIPTPATDARADAKICPILRKNQCGP